MFDSNDDSTMDIKEFETITMYLAHHELEIVVVIIMLLMTAPQICSAGCKDDF